jgi:hypothetical protein
MGMIEHTLRTVLRGLAVFAISLLAIAVVIFTVLANFSAGDSIYRCEGNLSEEGEARTATIFVTLTDYRWWVKLWSTSDGMVLVEAPQEQLPYEPYLGLEKVGDSARHIYDDSDRRHLRGAFYKVSGYLMLDTPRGHFEGNCTPV